MRYNEEIKPAATSDRRHGTPLARWTPFLAVVEREGGIWLGIGPAGDTSIDSYAHWKSVSEQSDGESLTPQEMAERGSGGRWWKMRPASDIGKLVTKLARGMPHRAYLHVRDGQLLAGTLPEVGTPQKVRVTQGYGGHGFILVYPLACAGSAELIRANPAWNRWSQVDDQVAIFMSAETDYQTLCRKLPADMRPVDVTPFPARISARVGGEKWLIRVRFPACDGLAVFALNASRPPSSIKVSAEQPAHVTFPSHEWRQWSAWLGEMSIAWTADPGFDPELPGRREVDETRLEAVPGWTSSTSTGRLLRDFQREGVRFLVSRAARALCADDMGLGKTGEAIATAVYQGGARNLVICPAGIKSVWRDELLAWDAALEEDIHTLDGTHDRPTPNDRWIIATYDQISLRSEVWKCKSREEAQAITEVLSRFSPLNQDDEDASPTEGGISHHAFSFGRQFPVQAVTDSIAAVLEEKRIDQWQRYCARRRGALLEALIRWAPDTLIFDEAHRVKNSDAKRTSAAMALSGSAESCLLLSGTPIQNRTSEPAVMLHVMDPAAFQKVKATERFTIARIKGLLLPSMIRRQKSEVLTQLPPVTEQIVRLKGFGMVDVEVPGPGGVPMSGISALIEAGHAKLDKSRDVVTMDERSTMAILRAAWSIGNNSHGLCPSVISPLGIFEMLRAAIGAAKAEAAKDILEDILESRGRGVVFTAHHAASDTISASVPANYSKAIIDGRVSLKAREDAVAKFQASEIDCLIAGMEAAGEGITLHRADTALFVELPVKASTLRQARDRLHRIGQTSPVQALYLISDHPVDVFFEALCLAKADLTGKVLGEEVHILADVRGETPVQCQPIEEQIATPRTKVRMPS